MHAGTQAAGGRSQLLVGLAVAVVVHQVAHLSGRALHGIADLFHAVYTVVYRVHAGTQAAGGRAQLFVGLAIAVVVNQVAYLGGSALHGVADLLHAVYAVVYRVRAGTQAAGGRAQFLVGLAVAVVVECIANLGGGSFHGIADLDLAVDAVFDRVQAHSQAAGGRAEILVDEQVAVVVLQVAQLRRARVGQGVVVVAVHVGRVAVSVGVAGDDEEDVVADLGPAGGVLGLEDCQVGAVRRAGESEDRLVGQALADGQVKHQQGLVQHLALCRGG